MKPFKEVCPHKDKHTSPDACQNTLMQELSAVVKKLRVLDMEQEMIRMKFYEVENYRPGY